MGTTPHETTHERRTPLAAIDSAFRDRLHEHFEKEEKRILEDTARHAVTEERHRVMAENIAAVTRELEPLKRMYHAVLGGGSLMVFLLAVITWVYTNDRVEAAASRQDVKTLATAVFDQGAGLRVILEKQGTMKEEQDRLRRIVDAVQHAPNGR